MQQEDKKSGFISFFARSLDNSSFAFYLAFVGVVIQFVHNLLAVAGTLNLFGAPLSLLMVGEWILAVTVAYFLGMSLFYYTIKAGSIGQIKPDLKPETIEERRKLKGKYNGIVIAFSIFDTFIDFYFWNFIVFMEADVESEINMLEMIMDNLLVSIVIVAVVVMLPQTLRLYTGEIEFKKHI